MLIIIDNYDSFTYNLVHLIGSLGYEIEVIRNDVIEVGEIISLDPTHIIISPGPGRPHQAGITNDLIRKTAGDIPIFGVCLGHQAIGEVFGGEVTYAREQVHGKPHQIFHEGSSIFTNIPNPFDAGRYHSLVLNEANLPKDISILAHAGDGQIMAIKHKQYPIFGVQFHPESILTEYGDLLLQNFLHYSTEKKNVNL